MGRPTEAPKRTPLFLKVGEGFGERAKNFFLVKKSFRPLPDSHSLLFQSFELCELCFEGFELGGEFFDFIGECEASDEVALAFGGGSDDDGVGGKAFDDAAGTCDF